MPGVGRGTGQGQCGSRAATPTPWTGRGCHRKHHHHMIFICYDIHDDGGDRRAVAFAFSAHGVWSKPFCFVVARRSVVGLYTYTYIYIYRGPLTLKVRVIIL